MPSVTTLAYNYQHGISVTSQVTFPASSTRSASDISQHQMPTTNRNDLENQRRDTSSFKVTGHIDFVSHTDWSY